MGVSTGIPALGSCMASTISLKGSKVVYCISNVYNLVFKVNASKKHGSCTLFVLEKTVQLTSCLHVYEPLGDLYAVKRKIIKTMRWPHDEKI